MDNTLEIDKVDAQKIAEAWVKENSGYAHKIRVYLVIETDLSFVFGLENLSTTSFYGLRPISINKKTGGISHPEKVYLEALETPSIWQRFQRWRARRKY